MLQSRVISEAFFTFVLSESLWFVSIERDFKGFTFQVSYFNLRQWWPGQTIGLRLKYCPWWDVLVVPPCDYQLRQLAVIPLVIGLVRQRPELLLTVKTISYRAVTFVLLVRIKLTRNNHCERGFSQCKWWERASVQCFQNTRLACLLSAWILWSLMLQYAAKQPEENKMSAHHDHWKTVPEMPKCTCSRSKRVEWSMVSKAADRSNSVRAVTLPLSMLHIMSLWILRRAVSVEWRSCGHESEPSMYTRCCLFEIYDLNHWKTVPEMPKCPCSRSKRVAWSMVSKAADRSNSVRAVTLPLSMLHIMSLWILRRAASVEWKLEGTTSRWWRNKVDWMLESFHYPKGPSMYGINYQQSVYMIVVLICSKIK